MQIYLLYLYIYYKKLYIYYKKSTGRVEKHTYYLSMRYRKRTSHRDRVGRAGTLLAWHVGGPGFNPKPSLEKKHKQANRKQKRLESRLPGLRGGRRELLFNRFSIFVWDDKCSVQQ